MFLEQDEEFLVHEVNHSVRQLCKTIDAFIFVVDSSTSKEKGKCFMRSKRTISIEPFPDILMFHVTSQFFILLTSPHGQGHHNSMSRLLWARITYPTLSTFPVGGNRSTRRKPTTFGRALTILFSHEDWVRVYLTGDRTRNLRSERQVVSPLHQRSPIAILTGGELQIDAVIGGK